MKDPKKQLHIPAPHDDSDRTQGVVELSLVAAAIFALTVGWWFMTRPPVEASTPKPAPQQGAEVLDKLTGEMRAQKKSAQNLDGLKPSELNARPWTDEEIIAVVRFGKRETAEAACTARAAQFPENTVSDPMRLELVNAVDRRSESAPYACLSRLFFEDKLPQDDLKAEFEEFWSEAERFEGVERLVADTVTSFRTTRQRPASPRFWQWLRACALNIDYEAASACQQLLHQVSPAEGADLVLTAVKHLEETPPPEHLPILVKALGHFARNGQPSTFRTVETKELPDYDVDFRLASVFLLCRFVNSPEEDVAFGAAEQLTKTARFGARSYDKNVLARWREGCRVAFGGQEKDETALPLIAVWTGNPDEKPDYRLSTEIEAGECELKDGYPSWHCGSKRWIGTGPLDKALEKIFVETSWVEWVDK